MVALSNSRPIAISALATIVYKIGQIWIVQQVPVWPTLATAVWEMEAVCLKEGLVFSTVTAEMGSSW
jgi:hypothetical protein